MIKKFNEFEESNIGEPISFKSINSFCNAKNDFRYTNPEDNVKTNRLKWLIGTLDKSGIDYELDEFQENSNIFYNLILKGSSDKMVVAHYDVVNIKSDNANDNSASVINAIMLKKLSPSTNVVILDGEEPPVLGAGSRRVSEQINNGKFGSIKWVLNLELSGKGGENFFIGNYPGGLSEHILKTFPDTPILDTPFNDSEIFIENGIDSVVINPLPIIEEESMLENDNGFLDISMLYNCHSMDDSLSTIDHRDMESFVKNIVLKLLK